METSSKSHSGHKLIDLCELWKKTVAFYQCAFTNLASIALPLVASLLVTLALSQINQVVFLLGCHVLLQVLIVIFEVISVVLSLLYVPALVIEIIKSGRDHTQSTESHPGRSHDDVLKDSYAEAISKFWSYFWISILASAIALAAYAFFIVPGIYVQTMLGFAIIVLFAEGKKGPHALAASWHYVRGHWWAVFGRMLLLAAVAFIALSLASFVGWVLSFGITGNPSLIAIFVQLFDYFVLLPFVLIYLYFIYESLKLAHPAPLSEQQFIRLKNTFAWIFAIGLIFGLLLFVSIFRLFSQYLPSGNDDGYGQSYYQTGKMGDMPYNYGDGNVRWQRSYPSNPNY